MRTLIIPDIHHQIERADYWLETQEFDHAVFLGDYFDDFEDHLSEAKLTAYWLRERMNKSQDIFLLGNHDIPYMFPEDPYYACSGFSRAKSKAIRTVLRAEHWDRFKIAHAEQGWFMSHAGFHPFWVREPTVEKILKRCDLALRRAKRHAEDPILGAGKERGGSQHVGGPLWMDWQSLVPIHGINQIVGHSPGNDVRAKITSDSKNICLELNSGYAAALVVDGTLTSLRE
ncbi:MAG: metallophosphoesterase [Verrucomicrobiota bacterium]